MTGKELLEKLQALDEETLNNTVYFQDDYYIQFTSRLDILEENWYSDINGDGVAESDLTQDELEEGLDLDHLWFTASKGSIIIS